MILDGAADRTTMKKAPELKEKAGKRRMVAKCTFSRYYYV